MTTTMGEVGRHAAQENPRNVHPGPGADPGTERGRGADQETESHPPQGNSHNFLFSRQIPKAFHPVTFSTYLNHK